MDFAADRRECLAWALGAAQPPLQTDRSCWNPPAEALEDFLLNFLAVEQDGAGKTVTRPKYMTMLVRWAHGPSRSRPPMPPV